MTKYDNDLFYACSLIEFIGRKKHLKRCDVVKELGTDAVRRIYKYADVLHCEPIERVADEYSEICNIQCGDFDNVSRCKYDVPDYWAIGAVYERLIEDVSDGDILKTLHDVYSSWISDAISNYNTDFFYQSRDYIKECYLANEVL